MIGANKKIGLAVLGSYIASILSYITIEVVTNIPKKIEGGGLPFFLTMILIALIIIIVVGITVLMFSLKVE